METEIWIPVTGWAGLYEVSNHGRVRSLATSFRAVRKGRMVDVRMKPKILKSFLTAGYPSVALCRHGNQRTEYIHRLVCEAFNGAAPTSLHEVAHGDGDKSNSSPDNLRWATRQSNLADKVAHGTQLRGDKLWFTKVSDANAIAVRQDRSKTCAQWAAVLGVSASLISSIRRGKRRLVGAL